jgi:hypothetical protein
VLGSEKTKIKPPLAPTRVGLILYFAHRLQNAYFSLAKFLQHHETLRFSAEALPERAD